MRYTFSDDKLTFSMSAPAVFSSCGTLVPFLLFFFPYCLSPCLSACLSMSLWFSADSTCKYTCPLEKIVHSGPVHATASATGQGSSRSSGGRTEREVDAQGISRLCVLSALGTRNSLQSTLKHLQGTREQEQISHRSGCF